MRRTSHVSIGLAAVDTNLPIPEGATREDVGDDRSIRPLPVPAAAAVATWPFFFFFFSPPLPHRRRLSLLLLLFSSTPTSQGSNKEATFFCSKKMVKAIRIHELGGPEVMKWEEVQVGEPKEGEIRIRTTAIGVNFIDIYFRKGVYSAPALPFTPGMEAVGVVTAVGPGLTGRKVGDVVAYAGNPMGSYAEEQILPARVAIPVLPSIDHKVAASVMLKGMTAHVLVRRAFKRYASKMVVQYFSCYPYLQSSSRSKPPRCKRIQLAASEPASVLQVQRGHTVLVHAAAGGVGSLLCQWANALGATVIGTVSNEEKAAQATQDGCHHVIIYTKEDVVARVKEITSGKGVNVVYDSVGKDTYKASVECLASRGFLVSFGQSSGIPDPIPLSDLASKSLFLTRPSMMHYTVTREELLESAGEVLPMW
ncbi:hypothetical protein PR202_gb18269 [Eleusine coracana subsp. coracana]|uniref:Probable quinone oxidoreductase n=1 Tax=Eleusine coracana subsp. coracana TaxID=191504 RepID=A0AAV5F572_ELECO|nr:hypothetical protein PR202_gb18269 [Eleusine coracana subsp. coracana]